MKGVRSLLAGSLGLLWSASSPALFAQDASSARPGQDGVISIVQEGQPAPEAAPGATSPTIMEMAPGSPSVFGDGVNWKKVPPVRVFPRGGFFPIPPSDPGYYSLADAVHGEYRQKAPKFPYPPFGLMPPSFFDADFRYLDDPKNTQHDIFDPLHRIHLGDNWLFNTGGQAWWRYMNEHNSRLSGNNNTYDLLRARVYGDLWYRDMFRFYAEFITAHSINQELTPLPVDVNRADLLNAFVDIKIFGCEDNPAYLRIGRQELLLGSQRLISTLDWANTRRTFQGVRAFQTSEKFDVDLFWVQPVIPNASKFDSVDNNQNFGGLWTTYKPEKGHFVDLYYLFLDNTNVVKQQGIDRAPYNVHTVGSRYAGSKDNWLWDVEGSLQFGERGASDIFAAMGTLGGGYNFKDAALNPTFWLYYDYASGDRNPNNGNFHTFNQLFPFGHYYFGWADLVGRQNINDLNLHLYLYPSNWITVWTQYHHFWLNSSKDALYNPAGVASRRDATGAAGNEVGDELDFIVNFHLGAHSDVQLGYCHLFGGNFIRNTGAGGDSASLFYAMYNFRW